MSKTTYRCLTCGRMVEFDGVCALNFFPSCHRMPMLRKVELVVEEETKE